MPQHRIEILREYAEGHSFLYTKQNVQFSRTPIVYIHGMGGIAGYFVPLMDRVSHRTGRFGYAVDIRGHGDHHQENIKDASVGDYIDDVAHFLKRVVIKKHGVLPTLVGHSMGGLIALALAARGYAENAVLITPAPPKGIENRMGRMLTPTLVDLHGFMLMCIMGIPFRPSRHLLAQLFADPVRDARLIDEILEEFETHESSRVMTELWMSAVSVEPRDVKVPLFIIGAEKDVLVHPSVFESIAHKYHATYSLVPNLGHLCPFETGWEMVAAHIESWVRRKHSSKKEKVEVLQS